jgi:hypothetical protein
MTVRAFRNYHYADYWAPDVYPSCPKNQCPQSWSLADFFTSFSNSPRQFVKVTGWLYDTYQFLQPSSYFTNYPDAPDDDVIDDQ